MRTELAILSIVMGITTGCGSSPESSAEGSSSASASSAGSGGGCSPACSPAATCADHACSCPTNFMPSAPMFEQELMRKDVAQLPGLVTGVGLIPQADKFNALLVAFDPATVPLGKDIDLATAEHDMVRVGFGFEVVALMTVRGGFLATSGTLELTDACEQGVSGVMSDVQGTEVDLFDDFAPIPGGCTLSVPSVTFSLGSCGAGGAGGGAR